jgi:hypothetical protein
LVLLLLRDHWKRDLLEHHDKEDLSWEWEVHRLEEILEVILMILVMATIPMVEMVVTLALRQGILGCIRRTASRRRIMTLLLRRQVVVAQVMVTIIAEATLQVTIREAPVEEKKVNQLKLLRSLKFMDLKTGRLI